MVIGNSSLSSIAFQCFTYFDKWNQELIITDDLNHLSYVCYEFYFQCVETVESAEIIMEKDKKNYPEIFV